MFIYFYNLTDEIRHNVHLRITLATKVLIESLWQQSTTHCIYYKTERNFPHKEQSGQTPFTTEYKTVLCAWTTMTPTLFTLL